MKYQEYLAGARVQVCEGKNGGRYVRLSRANGNNKYIDFPLWRRDWVILKSLISEIDAALEEG